MKTKNPTWKEYALNSIANYPSLYAAKNFEESEMLVALQTFLTNGNGMYWGSFESEEGPFVTGDYKYTREEDGEQQCEFVCVQKENRRGDFSAEDFMGKVWYERFHTPEPHSSLKFIGYEFNKPEDYDELPDIEENQEDENLSEEEKKELEKKKAEIAERIVAEILAKKDDKKDFKPYDSIHKNDCTEKVYSPTYLCRYDRGTVALQCLPEKMEPSFLDAAKRLCERTVEHFSQIDSKEMIDGNMRYSFRCTKEELNQEEMIKKWDIPMYNGENDEECMIVIKDRKRIEYKEYAQKVLDYLNGKTVEIKK